MAGKAKPKAATEASAKLDGLTLPCKLVPIAVYGCCRYGDWSDLNEKDGYFGFDHGRVFYTWEANGKTHRTDLGELPDGWACADIHHDESNANGWFVGLAEDIAEAERLSNARANADDGIGAMMYVTP